MSCDYDVYCVDCDSHHEFYDANHEDKLMLEVIKHRDAFAALAPVFEAFAKSKLYSELRFSLQGDRYAVSPQWFAKHAGHTLEVIDEYGRLLKNCYKFVQCKECPAQHNCLLLRDHEGPCSPRAPKS